MATKMTAYALCAQVIELTYEEGMFGLTESMLSPAYGLVSRDYSPLERRRCWSEEGKWENGRRIRKANDWILAQSKEKKLTHQIRVAEMWALDFTTYTWFSTDPGPPLTYSALSQPNHNQKKSRKIVVCNKHENETPGKSLLKIK